MLFSMMLPSGDTFAPVYPVNNWNDIARHQLRETFTPCSIHLRENWLYMYLVSRYLTFFSIKLIYIDRYYIWWVKILCKSCRLSTLIFPRPSNWKWQLSCLPSKNFSMVLSYLFNICRGDRGKMSHFLYFVPFCRNERLDTWTKCHK